MFPLLQLTKDFGEDKQQAVERTIASMRLDVEKARKQGEENTREQYMEEMKKLAAKHKEAISQAKKKQWVSIFFPFCLMRYFLLL